MSKNARPARGAGTSQGAGAGSDAQQNDDKTNLAESTVGLEVSSTRDGYRRAGMAWRKQPTIVPVSELTEEQVKMLVNDPDLIVRPVDLLLTGTGE